MNELSLHILDIVQNSIKANSKIVKIIINDDRINDLYTITIEDDGHGMDKSTLTEVADPFFTTRTTRKVGMGVSLFKMAAEMTEGSFVIDSELNKGTKVVATFKNSHIDRAPLGEIEETLSILILNDKEIDIYYEHIVNNKNYVFDTREVKKVLDGIPFTNYDVMMWIKSNIKDGIETIIEEEQK
jgi:nitrogen-specific signal transduction histidine kinase